MQLSAAAELPLIFRRLDALEACCCMSQITTEPYLPQHRAHLVTDQRMSIQYLYRSNPSGPCLHGGSRSQGCERGTYPAVCKVSMLCGPTSSCSHKGPREGESREQCRSHTSQLAYGKMHSLVWSRLVSKVLCPPTQIVFDKACIIWPSLRSFHASHIPLLDPPASRDAVRSYVPFT